MLSTLIATNWFLFIYLQIFLFWIFKFVICIKSWFILLFFIISFYSNITFFFYKIRFISIFKIKIYHVFEQFERWSFYLQSSKYDWNRCELDATCHELYLQTEGSREHFVFVTILFFCSFRQSFGCWCMQQRFGEIQTISQNATFIHVQLFWKSAGTGWQPIKTNHLKFKVFCF